MIGKKGVELSINFLVVVIISLVVLGFGLKFAYDLLNYAEKEKQQQYDKIDKELENLICEGADKVCVGTYRKKVGSSKSVFFGVKVWNILGSDQTFSMDVQPSGTCLIRKDKTTLDDCAGRYKITEVGQAFKFTISKQSMQKRVFIIDMSEATEPGTYIFNLQVKNGADNYGPMQKLYVEFG